MKRWYIEFPNDFSRRKVEPNLEHDIQFHAIRSKSSTKQALITCEPLSNLPINQKKLAARRALYEHTVHRGNPNILYIDSVFSFRSLVGRK